MDIHYFLSLSNIFPRIEVKTSDGSSKPLDPSAIQTFVEKTQLYDKGVEKRGQSMNVVGGVGIIEGIPHLDFSNITNFISQF